MHEPCAGIILQYLSLLSTHKAAAPIWLVLQELVALNAPKVHEKWRTLLRKAKTEELKQDIQWLADAHNGALQRKDVLIQVCRAHVAAFRVCKPASWRPASSVLACRIRLRNLAPCHRHQRHLIHW